MKRLTGTSWEQKLIRKRWSHEENYFFNHALFFLEIYFLRKLLKISCCTRIRDYFQRVWIDKNLDRDVLRAGIDKKLMFIRTKLIFWLYSIFEWNSFFSEMIWILMLSAQSGVVSTCLLFLKAWLRRLYSRNW